MTVKVEDIEYIKVGGYSNVPVIRVDEVNEFLKLVDKFKANQIFLTKKKYSRRNGDETKIEITDAPTYDKDEECVVLTEFLLYYDGAMYVLLGFNYNTISDLIKGRSVGFKYGDWYYEASKGGFSNYEEYKEAKRLGYETKVDYVDGEKRGFRNCENGFSRLEYVCYVTDGIGAWDKYAQGFQEIQRGLKSEGQVYYYAGKLGYENYDEFREGLSKGFENGEQYREATSKGFDHGNQYREATSLGIATKEQFDKYHELDQISYRYELGTSEESHIFSILLNPEIGRNVPLSKIWNILQNEQSKLKIDDERGKQSWYTRRFGSINDLKGFLSSGKSIQRIGTYDVSDDVIRISLPDRKAYEIAVVDGSNVAWNSGSKDRGDKPVASNIRLMVNALRERGFEKIFVIADASLYAVEDRKILSELEKEGVLRKAPSKEDADRFILEHAKEKDALIITNDTFKDWKDKDAWVIRHIDEHLVKFMIMDKVVTFGEYRYNEKIDQRLRSVKGARTTPENDDQDDYDIDE